MLVVDGGASMRCALLGDNIAEMAYKNGWSVRTWAKYPYFSERIPVIHLAGRDTIRPTRGSKESRRYVFGHLELVAINE